jgi:hypothetical protein
MQPEKQTGPSAKKKARPTVVSTQRHWEMIGKFGWTICPSSAANDGHVKGNSILMVGQTTRVDSKLNTRVCIY